jgi:iron(III) transport system substrate-binding protein
MKALLCAQIGLLAIVSLARLSLAASVDPALLKAKQEAESKGFVFINNPNEIVAKAKQEGKLRVLTGMEAPTLKASAAAFKKKYPFIELQIQETTGTDGDERQILEIKSGAKDWDVHRLAVDRYSDYIPYLFKIDILGMAQQGVLQIPPLLIDPEHRNALAFYNRFVVAAYNKNLIAASQVPKTWEDLLKPEFKGRKFAADIRPKDLAGLVPAWGLEKTLNFARRVAEQEPIWLRGGARPLTSIIAGELPMMIGLNNTSIKRAQSKDPLGVLRYAIFEPVPLRFGEVEAIQSTAPNRHAALLWFEWMASAEAQKIADEQEPFASSVFVRGGAVEQELKGKKLSMVGWEHHENVNAWEAKIVQAYGFPKVEVKR